MSTERFPMNRRSFLKQSAVVAAAVSAGPSFLAPSLFAQSGQSTDAKSKRHIPKGIMYATIGMKGSVMEKFQAAREAGFDGVEAMSHMKQEEVLAARDATGLKVPSVCGSKHWSH